MQKESEPGPYQFGGRVDRLEYFKAGYSFEHEQQIVDHWREFWDEYADIKNELKNPDISESGSHELERASDLAWDQFYEALYMGDIFGFVLAVEHQSATVRYMAADSISRAWEIDSEIAMAAALRLTHDEEVEVRYSALQSVSGLAYGSDGDSSYPASEFVSESEASELEGIFWLAVGNINAASENSRPPIFRRSVSF